MSEGEVKAMEEPKKRGRKPRPKDENTTTVATVLKEKKKLEEGYQDTVRTQIGQIRELVQMTRDLESDVLKLKAERDRLLEENKRLTEDNEELGRGLLAVRSGIDVIYRMMHEGEAKA